jgi:hypothetical protein
LEALDIDAIDWEGLPARLRRAMATRTVSHRRFADKAGVSPQAATKWLQGGRIAPERWAAVAAALNLTVPELLGLPEQAPQQHAGDRSTEAEVLLGRLAALAAQPFDRAVPDLMLVLRDARRLAEAHRAAAGSAAVPTDGPPEPP